MRLVVIFISVMLFVSCSTTKGKSEIANSMFTIIDRKTRIYNDTATNRKVFLQLKDFNPTQQLIFKLRGEIDGKKDFVYLFTWNNDLPTVSLRFSAILFDKLTKQKYYVFNNSNEKSILITTNMPDSFVSHDYILDEYLNGQFEVLKAMQNLFSSAEIGLDYAIYNIELSKHKADLLHLDNVVVMKR